VSRPGYITPFVPVVARAFEVSNATGQKIVELTRQFDRASIERILRGEQIIQPAPETILQTGDVVGISGRLEAVMAAGQLVGREIENREALSFAAKAVAVVITSREVVGQKLEQVIAFLGKEKLQGVYLSSLKRQGLALPILAGTKVRRGDMAELLGRPDQVDRVAALIGSAEVSGGKSDLAYHALAIVVGMLLGSLSVVIGGIPVTLGMGGGVLVAGLGFGWMHARYPVFGGLPGAAQWILSELGLSAFAAAVGLAAGPMAVAAIREHGAALLLTGVAVTLVPLIVALVFGRFVLRLNPVILLGAICGGQTVAAALNAVNEETDSTMPVLGFTVAYAIANVLLAVWGPVIVAFT
jgi:putative transport protein